MNTAWRRSCQPACLLQAGGKHTANPFRAEFKGKTLTANPRVVILGCNMPDCVIELPSTAGVAFARRHYWKLTQVSPALAGVWNSDSAMAAVLLEWILWSLAPSIVSPGCAKWFDRQRFHAGVFHPCAVQEQLMGPGGVQRRDQAQGASVEVSAKNSFFLFFFLF